MTYPTVAPHPILNYMAATVSPTAQLIRFIMSILLYIF